MLAAGYRHRPLRPAAAGRAARAMRAAGLHRGERALDAGGGPGGHAEVWAGQGAGAVVLDPFPAMLRRTSGRPGVLGVRGRSQAMPFGDRSFALAYFHLSLHFGDWRRSVAEASRVVRPGGLVWVWSFGHDYLRSSHLARWFPSAARVDVERFPDLDELADHMGGQSLMVERGSEPEDRRRTAGEWEAAVRARAWSTIQLVESAELEAGLAAFRANHPDPDQTLRHVLPYAWVAGRRVSE
jgi:SAM-dependent methyltransferase